MKLNELLKKLRVEKDYSYAEIADRLGFTRAVISNVEKNHAPVSENLLKAYINLFPNYEKILLKQYLQEKIPEGLKEKISIESKKIENKKATEQNVKIYNYDSSGYGRVILKENKEVTFVLNRKISEESILIEVADKFMEPHFIDGDILLFDKEEFKSWESLNRKLVAVNFREEIIIRKLIFKNAIPYLVAFNNEVYADIKVNDEIIYLGELSELLKRKNMKNIIF